MLNKVMDTVMFVILTILESIAIMITVSNSVLIMETGGFMLYALDAIVYITITTGIYFATALKFIENDG